MEGEDKNSTPQLHGIKTEIKKMTKKVFEHLP